MTTLDHKCEICKAEPGEKCWNTLRPGEPLPGRANHLARELGVTAAQRESEANDACH